MSQQTIGGRLSDAREALPASLYEASRETKIRVDFLEAMERDDFDFVSGGLYVRGMLRSYVRWLGLDEESIIAEYDRLNESKPEPSIATMIAKPAEVAPKQKRPQWVIAGVAAASILLILSLIGVMGPMGNVAPPPSAPAEVQVRPTNTPSGPGLNVAEAPINVDGVKLKLQVVDDRCWIAAYLDGNDRQAAFQGTLEPGDEKTFQAEDQVKLVIGNLGAVRINLNGRDLGTPGEMGRFATMNFGSETQSFAG
ncbi:MAG: DUF4115 domain-containing protein [Actinomycetota bacterium]|nr:DUF4115 domain-containing protein [Actinomycetota bacterium]